MIELISNAAQLLVTLSGFALSAFSYIRTKKQAYFPLLCFYGCFALAGLYWTLYLLLYQRTPLIVSVSYVGWNTALIFLYILLDTLASPEERLYRCRACWLAVLAGLPVMAVICLRSGSISHLIACVLVIMVAWQAIRALAFAPGPRRPLCIALLAYAAMEYALWTVACFFTATDLSNPYYWIDFLLTATLFVLYPAARKAVGA